MITYVIIKYTLFNYIFQQNVQSRCEIAFLRKKKILVIRHLCFCLLVSYIPNHHHYVIGSK